MDTVKKFENTTIIEGDYVTTISLKIEPCPQDVVSELEGGLIGLLGKFAEAHK